jgi:nicotinamidase-related amidase
MFGKKRIEMKKLITPFILASLTLTLPACDVLNDAAGSVLDSPVSGNGDESANKLTNQEVISGLKEALTVGIRNAVDVTSVTDGFLGNQAIKLPFPESAERMKEKALEWGLDNQVDKIVTTLNRAAEDAAKEATPIFVNAIKNMSVQDGFAILNGGEGAATSFLKKNTRDQLVEAFSPKVEESIKEVKLTEYWDPVMKKYNQATTFTGGEKVETDLNKYVTDKAITGLFHMVEKEENKIRKDPAARVTDLLTKVFGSIGR